VLVETVALAAILGFLALTSIAAMRSLRHFLSCFFAFHGLYSVLVAFLFCGIRKLPRSLLGLVGDLLFLDFLCGILLGCLILGLLLLLQLCQLKICVINKGTISTTLSMSVGDWVPLIARQYLTITWNYASGTRPDSGETFSTFNFKTSCAGSLKDT
jgi:hypothetical protein